MEVDYYDKIFTFLKATTRMVIFNASTSIVRNDDTDDEDKYSSEKHD